MEKTGTDDVSRLLLQLNLDSSRYKVFRDKPGSWRLGESGAAPVAQDLAARDLVESSEENEQETVAPLSFETLAKAVTSHSQPAETRNWTVLDSLFSPGSFHAPGKSHATLSDPLKPFQADLAGICGGVGTTTIISALARIEAKSARRVLLRDGVSPSLLPLYFGAQSPRSQLSTFAPVGHPHEGPIHISCDSSDETVRALLPEIDCYYFDRGLLRGTEGNAAPRGRGISILVMVPDTRCVVELNQILEKLSLQKQGMNSFYLLLNQFEPLQPLHREIQHRLQKQFNGRLIPVAISHDADVSAALAQGTTIVDYAPNSTVTKNLYKVNEWLTAKSTKSTESESKMAGQRL